jgi:hypothetical protein
VGVLQAEVLSVPGSVSPGAPTNDVEHLSLVVRLT